MRTSIGRPLAICTGDFEVTSRGLAKHLGVVRLFGHSAGDLWRSKLLRFPDLVTADRKLCRTARFGPLNSLAEPVNTTGGMSDYAK